MTCKVIKTISQQLIENSGDDVKTNIRYLVVTDKGTFTCETSILNWKFKNSDIFWRIHEDSIYTFKVAGVGKGTLFDYPNIIQIKN